MLYHEYISQYNARRERDEQLQGIITPTYEDDFTPKGIFKIIGGMLIVSVIIFLAIVL